MEKRDLLFIYLEVHGFFNKIYPLKKKKKRNEKLFFLWFFERLIVNLRVSFFPFYLSYSQLFHRHNLVVLRVKESLRATRFLEKLSPLSKTQEV